MNFVLEVAAVMLLVLVFWLRTLKWRAFDWAIGKGRHRNR